MHTHTHARARARTHTHAHAHSHAHAHAHGTHFHTFTHMHTHAHAWSCAGDELASLRAQLAEQATELERLRKRNAALEAEREKIIYNASRSSDRRRDQTVKRTTERLFEDLAEVQMDDESRIGDLVAHIDALELRTFATTPKSANCKTMRSYPACLHIPMSRRPAPASMAPCAATAMSFFWKASLSIELPLTAHDPIHP